MTKKIFALVMVVSVLGAAFLAGCKKDDASADSATSAGASTAAGATSDAKTTS